MMSESCRENLPLLCDDSSDEDFRIRKSSPKFQRLFRYPTSSGRARSQAIGAAAIITRWPEHFSSLLTYWWIGLGMIAFMIFVIYNSIVAISMLPPTHHKPVKINNTESTSENTSHKSSKPNIFMHIFITNYDELNVNYYLPHIDKFSKKYSNLKHNLIVVLKDVSNDNLNNLSDELNNEIALNSLWLDFSKKDNKIKLGKNTNFQIISLTKYMDESPLKKYWRHLPQQFFGFLIRCIAIWDKGGIAFDPLILTPNSPHLGYIENLEHILGNLKSRNLNKSIKKNILKTPKKKINNIRDIIDNIENQDKNIMQEHLLEAENKKEIFKIDSLKSNKSKRKTRELPLDKHEKLYVNIIKENKTNDFEEILYKNKIDKKSAIFNEDKGLNHLFTTYKIKNENQLSDEITTKRNLLPMFLEYLFHQPQNNIEHTNELGNTILNITLNKNSTKFTLKNIPINNKKNNSIKTNLLEKKAMNTKVIKSDRNSSENENKISLNVDLKGNLIATETPCHAFIGTIFSNVLHHSDDESITDFIITELSIFCKGVLSSCKGVDVIIL